MNINWEELKNMPVLPIGAIAGGVVILIFPEVLAYLVAVAMIVYGGMELANKRG